MEASQILVDLLLQVNEVAQAGTEALVKWANEELHKVLGVDACLLSLTKSTILEVEELPKQGSLVKLPFSYQDRQQNSRDAILWVTWKKLLDVSMKPRIEKLCRQVSRIIKSSLQHSTHIDHLRQSVTDKQIGFLSRLAKAEANLTALFELGNACVECIQSGWSSSLWFFDKNRNALITCFQGDDVSCITPGKPSDIVSVTHDYGKVINIADTISHNMYVPEPAVSINKPDFYDSTANRIDGLEHSLSVLSIPLRDPHITAKHGVFLLTRVADGSNFSEGDVKFAQCCASIFSSHITFFLQAQQNEARNDESQKLGKIIRQQAEEIMALKREVRELEAMGDEDANELLIEGVGHRISQSIQPAVPQSMLSVQPNDASLLSEGAKEVSAPLTTPIHKENPIEDKLTMKLEERIELKEKLNSIQQQFQEKIQNATTNFEVEKLELNFADKRQQQAERSNFERELAKKNEDMKTTMRELEGVKQSLRDIQLKHEHERKTLRFLERAYKQVKMVSDLFTCLPHAFETLFQSGSCVSSFYAYDETKNDLSNGASETIPASSEDSPLSVALRLRQGVKTQTLRVIDFDETNIEVYCVPVQYEGRVLGVVKVEVKTVSTQSTIKHSELDLMPSLTHMASYIAPLVFVVISHDKLKKNMKTREVKMIKSVDQATAALESMKSKSARLEMERKELYISNEELHEKLRTSQYDNLVAQRKIARLERDVEILETKASENPQVGFNEEMLRITTDYETLKRKYRSQTSRFERVVELLKAYPETEAPLGLDTLIVGHNGSGKN